MRGYRIVWDEDFAGPGGPRVWPKGPYPTPEKAIEEALTWRGDALADCHLRARVLEAEIAELRKLWYAIDPHFFDTARTIMSDQSTTGYRIKWEERTGTPTVSKDGRDPTPQAAILGEIAAYRERKEGTRRALEDHDRRIQTLNAMLEAINDPVPEEPPPLVTDVEPVRPLANEEPFQVGPPAHTLIEGATDPRPGEGLKPPFTSNAGHDSPGAMKVEPEKGPPPDQADDPAVVPEEEAATDPQDKDITKPDKGRKGRR